MTAKKSKPTRQTKKKNTRSRRSNKKKTTTNKKQNTSQYNSKRKTFVIDTNIILNDHTAPFSIPNADIVLPQMVVRELDKKQDFNSKSVAFNARAFGRKLRTLLRKQQSTHVKLQNGATIILEGGDPKSTQLLKRLGLDPHKADSLIVASAWKLKKNGRDVTLLTNDTNMWVTACSLSIRVEDYQINKQDEKPAVKDVESEDLYSGVEVLNVESDIVNRLHQGEKVELEKEYFPGLHNNEIVVLKSGEQQSALAVFKGYDKPLKKIPSKFDEIQFAGVQPINKEQAFAFSLLDDKDVSCITLSGKAGTGKSMVALSYAMEYLGNQGGNTRFDKVLILKPVVPVGRDLGFLPGSLDEKLEPWMKSFMDALDVIFKSDGLHEKDGFKFREKPHQEYLNRGLLEFQPLTFMRGRSLLNTLVILDECQNCSVHEVKTLITRIGEGSKVICLGDVEQVDVPWLDKTNNGLAYLIERGCDAEMIGHINFIKSHRSELAEWASENL